MRLLINMPPSIGKSMWVCVILPAWIWTKHPGHNISYYSNHWRLIKRDLQYLKNIIQSKWWNERWPDLRIQAGRNAMYNFELETGGSIYGATPGSGSSTGTHPDVVLFEDPQTREQAENKIERDYLNDWYFDTMGSRGIGKDAVHVISQQRFHQEDLSGAIKTKYEAELKEFGTTEVVHLSLPMRYRADLQPPATMPVADWRVNAKTEDEKLLFPEFMTEAKVRRLEKTLSRKSKWAIETQLQQNVTSKAGPVFDTSKLRHIDENNPMPKEFDRVVRFWDRAATDKEEDADACYTSGVAIGMIGDSRFYVLDVVRGQWGWQEVEDNMGACMAMDCSRWGWETVTTVFEHEPAAAGKQVAEMTVKKFAKYRIYAYRPTKNKGVRAQPLGAAMGRYEVWVDPLAPWYLDWVTELQGFSPLDGGFKDQADSSGGAYNELINPSSEVEQFYTPPVDREEEESKFPSYGSSQPCRHPGCRRPAFDSAETDGYCCKCCRDTALAGGDPDHLPRCNGQYNDWYIRMKG